MKNQPISVRRSSPCASQETAPTSRRTSRSLVELECAQRSGSAGCGTRLGTATLRALRSKARNDWTCECTPCVAWTAAIRRCRLNPTANAWAPVSRILDGCERIARQRNVPSPHLHASSNAVAGTTSTDVGTRLPRGRHSPSPLGWHSSWNTGGWEYFETHGRKPVSNAMSACSWDRWGAAHSGAPLVSCPVI